MALVTGRECDFIQGPVNLADSFHIIKLTFHFT